MPGIMKKLFLSSVALLVFSASISIFQISCYKRVEAQSLDGAMQSNDLRFELLSKVDFGNDHQLRWVVFQDFGMGAVNYLYLNAEGVYEPLQSIHRNDGTAKYYQVLSFRTEREAWAFVAKGIELAKTKPGIHPTYRFADKAFAINKVLLPKEAIAPKPVL
jgi:hypothetical protein